jgi:uncharacterized protein involved in response to NO
MLLAAPHRLAFAAALLVLAAASAWWALALALAAPAAAQPLRFSLPLGLAHGLLMSLGFAPLFFTGFLFTAGPRWLATAAIDARAIAAPVLAQVAGWALFIVGVHGPGSGFAARVAGIGLGAVALGWTAVWWRFVAMLRASRVDDRRHARLIAVGGAVGVIVLWAAALCVAIGTFGALRALTQAALWGFVGIVFIAASHRMTPFFSGAGALPALDAARPLWLLGALVALLAIEGAGAVADALAGPLPAALTALQAAPEVAGGLLLLGIAWRWAREHGLRFRLVTMLYVGFVWLGLGLVLAGLSHAMQSASGGAASLGLAPLHAITMGYLGSTLVAMVTRVSSGHSGRAVVADDRVWRLFWALLAATCARIAAAIVAALDGRGATPLLVAAALGWAAVVAGWAWHCGNGYGRPRADGRAG